MSLDLKKVITQLKSLEGQELQELDQGRLDSTYKLFQFVRENQQKLLSKLQETQSTGSANFFFAVPDFPPDNEKVELDQLFNWDEDFALPHITIATDGSQINSSAHEFTNASLINIGLVGIPYFDNKVPVLLTSEPTVYTSQDDVIPIKTIEGIEEEELISYERTLKEVEELVNIAKKYSSYKLPTVALLDGTLIHWHIERFNSIFIKHFIKRFSEAIFTLKSLGVAVASFLSNSRSNDLINMLRIFKCPYDFVECRKYCSDIDSKNLPCNPTLDYKPVLDRRLVEKHLINEKAKLGVRTMLFKSNSKILNYYPEDLKVFFFYMYTGNEVARIELPSYVVKDAKLLTLIHNAISLQCKVGYGYPVTISEAHLLAVINKTDRQVFYDLIKQKVLRKGQAPIKLSNKELKKRISFV